MKEVKMLKTDVKHYIGRLDLGNGFILWVNIIPEYDEFSYEVNNDGKVYFKDLLSLNNCLLSKNIEMVF